MSSSKNSVINVSKTLLKHAYHPLMDQLVTVASNTAHVDTSGLNCIAEVSTQNNIHVTRRYSDCMLKFNNMLKELSALLAKVRDAYTSASYAIAGFEDYCKHHCQQSTSISLGNIGSINMCVTFTKTNSSVTDIPCFITHADSMKHLINTLIPVSGKCISSANYDSSHIDKLKTNSKKILVSSIEFVRSISVCNGNLLTSSSFIHSNIKLPVYVPGTYSSKLSHYSPEKLYLEMNCIISNLNSCNKVFLEYMTATMSYIESVIIPTFRELQTIMED